MEMVFASDNDNKLRELQCLLQPMGVTLLPQRHFSISSIPETGLSFVENAILKARHASSFSKCPVISDDSGLEVAILQGMPGIYSARFAGENANASDNIDKLLNMMKDVPDEKRMARFYCVIVFLLHDKDPTPLICEGKWDGFILRERRGENGFGYDPIFFDAHEGCSAAQLSMDIKNKISHRGQAIQCLLQTLPNKITENEIFYLST